MSDEKTTRALTRVQRPTSILDLDNDQRGALSNFAKHAAASALYSVSGIKNESQALAKIIMGVELGIPATRALTEIHVVKDQLRVGSGVLASLLRQHPHYDYRRGTHTDESCTIIITYDGEPIGEETFTIADAKKAGLTRNPVWATYPKNMLFARAIGNAVKWIAPDLTNGPVYVEGEMDDVPERDITPTASIATSDTQPVVDMGGLDDIFAAPLASATSPPTLTETPAVIPARRQVSTQAVVARTPESDEIADAEIIPLDEDAPEAHAEVETAVRVVSEAYREAMAKLNAAIEFAVATGMMDASHEKRMQAIAKAQRICADRAIRDALVDEVEDVPAEALAAMAQELRAADDSNALLRSWAGPRTKR